MKSPLISLLFFIIEIGHIRVFLIISNDKNNRDRGRDREFSLNDFSLNDVQFD